MFQLVYASSETCSFSATQLVELLQKSRQNNEKLGITGMLLYLRGHFLQVLEGEETAVRDLVARIASDPRHAGLGVLHSAWSPNREFPDWSMGFRNLDQAVSLNIEGYTRILDSGISAASFATNPPAAKRLLLAFKNGDAVASPRLAPAAAP